MALASTSPAGPTNGSPARSSRSPGCSPTSITRARAGPAPNTVWVPVRHSGQARQPAAARRRLVSEGRDGISSCAGAPPLLIANESPVQIRVRAPPTAGSARPADRVDQIPLAHLRAAGDVALHGDLVQLLAIAVLERVPGPTATLPTPRRLLAESAAGRSGQVGDGSLAPRRLARLLDVALCCPHLLRRCHLHTSKPNSLARHLPALKE